MATVTIQYQETRKPYRWVNAFRARVLFADRKTILVRGAGSESLFRGNGDMNMAGYHRDHPAAKKIPWRHGGWRIHPTSLARLKERQ